MATRTCGPIKDDRGQRQPNLILKQRNEVATNSVIPAIDDRGKIYPTNQLNKGIK